MKKMSWMAALLVIGLSVAVSAQKADADAQKIQEDYTAAFNKGDAKAIGGAYTQRMAPGSGRTAHGSSAAPRSKRSMRTALPDRSRAQSSR